MLLEETQITILDQMFSHTREAVFATDSTHHIVYQNPIFSQMLQCPAAQISGHKCYEVLQGRTLDGHRFCGADCPAGRELVCGRAVDNFDLVISRPNRQPMWLSIGAFAIPRAIDRVAAIFVLRPVNALQAATGFPGPVAQKKELSQKNITPLTRREQQILQLLASGSNTDSMAQSLHISHITVRRHAQNLFTKLGVHSRAEAVSYAYRHHLV